MTTPIRRALVSVSDKTGLEEFGRYLAMRQVEIISTGGSAQVLKNADVPVTEIESFTGFPEMMDGRVKTLHPKVHGGILARRGNPADEKDMTENDVQPIDMVVVNLYPFQKVMEGGADDHTCIETIDVGGPTLIRAAAKNHQHVTVVTNPGDYDYIKETMQTNNGTTTEELRHDLAWRAFRHTAEYDKCIAEWFNKEEGTAPAAVTDDETFPRIFNITTALKQTLRYGENPHQKAAFYTNNHGGIADAKQLQGKELSYNNLNDADAALHLVADFTEPAAAIIKHTNPCGVAIGSSIEEAFKKAYACDEMSAFGGIVAFNRPLNAATAKRLSEFFVEVIIAPEISSEARKILAKKKNLRVLGATLPTQSGINIKSVSGGFLVQQADTELITAEQIEMVSQKKPTEAELEDMLFAFTACKHVKSNAILLAKEGASIGIGAGQMSRVDATIMAIKKAGDRAAGTVLASDAFIPFPDVVEAAHEAGVSCIIQPGGSKGDDTVIQKVNELGMIMVFTGMRHFRH